MEAGRADVKWEGGMAVRRYGGRVVILNEVVILKISVTSPVLSRRALLQRERRPHRIPGRLDRRIV